LEAEKTAYIIGLTTEQFWGCTLKEFEKKIEAFKALEKKQDFRTAQICAIIANVNRDSKKKRRPYQPKDFMPKEKEKRQQTWQEQYELMKRFTRRKGDKNG